jgi:hypothetical protein
MKVCFDLFESPHFSISLFSAQLRDSLDNPKRVWREGRFKIYFCYILLDPRILNESQFWHAETYGLKGVSRTISKQILSRFSAETEQFAVFCESVFYIGKGCKSRSHEQLKEAAQASQSGYVSRFLDKSGFIIYCCSISAVTCVR